MHLTDIALTNGARDLVWTMAPTKVEKLLISSDLLTHTKNQILDPYTLLILQVHHDAEGLIYVLDGFSPECRILIEGSSCR